MENMKLYFMLAVLIIGRDYKKEVDYFLNLLHIQAYSPAKADLLYQLLPAFIRLRDELIKQLFQ